MKKLILLMCLLIATPTLAFDKAKCAAGNGTVVTAKDGTEYCLSPFGMNWWSAFAWCDGVGGSLVDYTEECFKVKGSRGCPNFSAFSLRNTWTQNPADLDKACILYNSGELNCGFNRNNAFTSICK